MERSEAAEVDSALVAEGAFGVRVTLLYIASSVRHSEQAWLVPEVDLLLSGNPGNEDAALLAAKNASIITKHVCIFVAIEIAFFLIRWARYTSSFPRAIRSHGGHGGQPKPLVC